MRANDISRGLAWCAIALCLAFAGGWYAPTACASAINIDSFAAPGAGYDFYSFGVVSYPPPVLAAIPSALIPTTDPGSILGGERVLAVDVVGTPNWKSFAGTIGSAAEVLSVATWGASGSKVVLSYPAIPSVDLTDGGSNNAIDFGFDFLEAGSLNVKIEVTGAGGSATFDSALAPVGNVAPKGSPFVYTVPFDQFDKTGNPFLAAESIVITLNDLGGSAAPNVDFELDYVSATEVPEPSTVVLLLSLGSCLAVATWRRRTG